MREEEDERRSEGAGALGSETARGREGCEGKSPPCCVRFPFRPLNPSSNPLRPTARSRVPIGSVFSFKTARLAAAQCRASRSDPRLHSPLYLSSSLGRKLSASASTPPTGLLQTVILPASNLRAGQRPTAAPAPQHEAPAHLPTPIVPEPPW